MNDDAKVREVTITMFAVFTCLIFLMILIAPETHPTIRIITGVMLLIMLITYAVIYYKWKRG
jgi:hypothetical protein